MSENPFDVWDRALSGFDGAVSEGGDAMRSIPSPAPGEPTEIDGVEVSLLLKAEAEILTRPSDFGNFTDWMYVTHGPVLSWADRGDCLVEESNFFSALERLRTAAGEDTDHVIDGDVRHWLVGNLRQIYVQPRDEDDNFTAAFIEAVRIADELRDYPLLNEDDHSERENARFEKSLDEALGHCENHHVWDSEQDNAAIRDLLWEDEWREQIYDLRGYHDNSWVSEGDVQPIWDDIRNAVFEKRAADALFIGPVAQCDGQTELFTDQESGATK